MGFVQEQNLRLESEQDGDLQLSLLAVGQHAGREGPFFFQQNVFQYFVGLILQFFKMAVMSPEIEAKGFPRLNGHTHVFEDAEQGEDIGQLKRTPHAQPCSPGRA